MSQTSFFSSRAARILALVLLFGSALAIRLYDLTDLPLDFHPTRQLVSFIKARGLYYETQPDGISTWQLETGIRIAKLKADIEPVVFERLVAFTYRFTGEQIWVARIYSSFFWLIGGIFLFRLAQEFVSYEGALISTAYYLIFPYAVIGSRSFQPDILMVMLVLAFWWTFARWMYAPSWIKAVLAGLLGGFAIFIKFSAVFFVIGGALGLSLSRFTLRELMKNLQVWIVVLLGAVPAAIYVVYGTFIKGYLTNAFSGRFVPALLLSPFHYLQWETKASMAAGGLFIMLGLLGFFLIQDGRLRIFLYGLWGGYIAYALFFDYHSATHDYYHLPLIPIVAISLAPLGDAFFAYFKGTTVQGWMRTAVYLILAYGLFAVLWDVRNQMKAVDYRSEAKMWAEIGNEFEGSARIIALTQDYGSRLQYWGFQTVSTWPYAGDTAYANIRGGIFTFDDLFSRYSSKMSYFLVTDFEELDRQPELKARLANSYPVFLQGDGYVIYDLKKPLQQGGNGS